jgi:hypothetical protein
MFDYKLSLEEIIAACLFDWANEQINSNSFLHDKTSAEENEVSMLHFKKYFRNNEAILGLTERKLIQLSSFILKHSETFPLFNNGKIRLN